MRNLYIKIGKRKVGLGFSTFIIAELSANHHQNYKEAVALIKAAAKSGADAVKIQTYTPDTMTIDSHKKWFIVNGPDNPNSWKGKTLYQLYQNAYTPWDWQLKLKKVAEKLGLVFFSTPFDPSAVDFLESINVPCYKISSYELTDLPLLAKVAKTRKPIIASTGFATLTEIREAVKTLIENGAREIALLHCLTSYSARSLMEFSNLATIDDLRKRFGVVTGLSDNNAGIKLPIIAAIKGASIIEKHFTLDRSKGGPDADFSLEPKEFTQMVVEIRNAEKANGKARYGPTNKAEKYNRHFRRSIFSITDIKKGGKISQENIKIIRPDNGLAPKYYYSLIGKTVSRNITKGTPLSWRHIVFNERR